MDSKRSKYCALRQLLCIVCLLAMSSCTWVKDDTDDCPYGFWLKLCYTYNILDVEAAPKYVTDAYVYVYDADGNYIKRIYVTQKDLTANDYRVRVEGLQEGDYQFVVWSGLDNSQYEVWGDNLTVDDFRLSLSEEGFTSKEELPALYHGYLPTVHYDDSYAQHEVELMKNTNQLACVVVSIDQTTEIDADDYVMKVVADNGIMDAYNQPVAEAVTTYEPYSHEYVTIDDPDYGVLHGVRYGIMTLRLMSEGTNRLVFEKKSADQELLNISLPESIGMIGSLYTNLGRELSVQEYLDRQDFYTVVFFLSGELDQLIQLQVNQWRLRANNHLKL